MTRTIDAVLLVTLLIPAGLTAAARADLSGHWEGVLQAPEMTLDFQIDVTRTQDGAYAGTISLPGERLHGLPLKVVALDGQTVRFNARRDQTFTGTLSEDGSSIAGEFSMAAGAAPFRLTRTGDATIEPLPRSPRISDGLAGTWTAEVATHQGSVSAVLTLWNTAEGHSTGRLVNLSEGGLELPLAIDETANGVTLRTTPLASSFTGTLSGDARVLEGTYRQGTQLVPITFRKAQN